MRLPIVVLLSLMCGACDIRIESGAAPTSPTGPTITNTNTNTNTVDRSDTGAAPPASNSGGSSSTAPLPLPAYGERVTRDVAAANPALLANSCQETSGDQAWGFLDTAIRTLRAQDNDPRWGYLCKDPACRTVARDVIAYRATSTTTGIWIVDVIGNHCPGPNDPPAAVRWGVLPFETARPWAASRHGGF